MRTTDNFDHESPRRTANDSRAANTAARNQAPRQPVRRPPVQTDNDSYDDDIRYDEDLDEQEEQYDPEYDEYDEDGIAFTPWYESFWFICVCLVIFPPYALYRIWKDERFSLTNRWLIFVIDVCWLLILLILLFSSLFAKDTPAANTDGLNPMASAAIDISSPAPSMSANPLASANPAASPIASPSASGAPAASSMPGIIVQRPSVAPGSTLKPSNAPGAPVGATAKPDNAGTASDKVWYTAGGTYYHSDSTCGGTMSGAKQHTLEEAQAANKRRCPYCYDGVSRNGGAGSGHSASAPSHPKPHPTARVTPRPTVRATARPQPPATPTPVPTPVSTSPYAVMVYYNVNGEYYHSISNCQGMKNAGYYTIGQAIDAGKKRCPICNAPEPGSTVTPSPSPKPTPTPKPTPVVHIVWYRPDSTWYHSVSNCQGMTGATRHTLGEAVDENKQPCPYCHPPKPYS